MIHNQFIVVQTGHRKFIVAGQAIQSAGGTYRKVCIAANEEAGKRLAEALNVRTCPTRPSGSCDHPRCTCKKEIAAL